jgi:hypothetical protein
VTRTMLFALLAILFAAVVGCHRQNTPSSFTADVYTASIVPGAPALYGKLYLHGKRLKLDWGQFADVFDIQQRKGWRITPAAHAYQELSSKDLSTFAPEMTNGSPCPHAQVPSACNLVGSEVIDGRKAKKWDVYNPNGFHVYFWTDDALEITLRMAFGDTTDYQVKDLRQRAVPDWVFELPSGYEKLDRPFRP